MISKQRLCGLVFAISVVIAGCRPDFGPVVMEPDPIPQSYIATRLQTGERLKVTVYGEPNLSGFYDISPSGTVSLPLAGTIRAAGRTRAEIERDITRKYGESLQEPKVSVEVVEFPLRMFGGTWFMPNEC